MLARVIGPQEFAPDSERPWPPVEIAADAQAAPAHEHWREEEIARGQPAAERGAPVAQLARGGGHPDFEVAAERSGRDSYCRGWLSGLGRQAVVGAVPDEGAHL